MEPNDNKQLALQKAINAHEQAAAAITDLMAERPDPGYAMMLERIQENIAHLKGAAAVTGPEDVV